MSMKVIAENVNVMSRSLGPAMKERNAAPIIAMAKQCAENGADYLDINIGPARKNGDELLEWIVKTIQSEVQLPLFIDTTNQNIQETGLKFHNNDFGRPIINSIDAVAERMDFLMPLAKKYDAGFVALMYGKDGIPRDTDERGILAADLIGKSMEYGFEDPEALFFDPIVVPVSSQQNQVLSCWEATGMIDDMMPGAMSTCGLSNVSNGSPEHLRAVINQTYLMMLKRQGMRSAIMDGLDTEIISIAKGEHPEWEAVVAKAMDGEAIDMDGLSERERNYVKTVKILKGDALYSDSWLEL